MRVIIAMMLYTVQSAVHAVDQGGGNFTEVVYVNDSVVLNSYIEFRVDEKQFSGFLVTFANKMDVHRESCVILDGLLVLQVNERNISFGCSHYIECRKNLDHISIAIVDKRTHLEQYILTGFGISSLFLSITLLMIAYQWHSAKRNTNHNQYVKNIFGDRVKQRDSTDPEETVALLAMGLRNFLPRMAPAPPCPPVQLRSMSYSRVGL
uniref:CUB domain-containing protein n=1 Tax=Panagrellus redivivus TaxID=6233 RepID=A0A7E4W3J1_PANRE